MQKQDRTRYERQLKKKGFSQIGGIDEVGRGPLAGPVVAAVCILPENAYFAELNDSKTLTPNQREALFAQLLETDGVHYGIGSASHIEIDEINILQATFLSMQRAVMALQEKGPDYLLIDGNRAPKFEIPHETIVKGDSRSVSIAAASIIAKVTRDREMTLLDKKWPEYGFRSHKGYGTKRHLEAIAKWGPCPIHRRTWKNFSLKEEDSPLRQGGEVPSAMDR